jgi:hypothetical protein
MICPFMMQPVLEALVWSLQPWTDVLETTSCHHNPFIFTSPCPVSPKVKPRSSLSFDYRNQKCAKERPFTVCVTWIQIDTSPDISSLATKRSHQFLQWYLFLWFCKLRASNIIGRAIEIILRLPSIHTFLLWKRNVFAGPIRPIGSRQICVVYIGADRRRTGPARPIDRTICVVRRFDEFIIDLLRLYKRHRHCSIKTCIQLVINYQSTFNGRRVKAAIS